MLWTAGACVFQGQIKELIGAIIAGGAVKVLVRKLKADPGIAAIPVVMLTAKGQEADKQKGFHVGADELVTQPFRPSKVVKRVKAVLG